MDTSKSPFLKPLALMWRGNINAPDQPTNHPERLKPLIAEFERLGVEARQVVYFDADAEATRDQLKSMSGVLVWINPVQDGQDRVIVDAMLRDVSAAGTWVSAHPDTILKMGTKEVLYRTRELGWGADTDLYSTYDEFALRFPIKLSVAGPRVLKPLRGNDGRGVFRVEALGSERVRLQEAIDDRVETLPLAQFIQRSKEKFSGFVDQPFQNNVKAGMVRVYMSQNRVVGFSEQAPRNLTPSSDQPAFGMNSAKTMHGAD
ncbi:MAG TPA: Cj0069 family protein, partial [Hyphomonadaceae bacterium]|nr:Cj0069 family protein [Hyphomonadaceae bacterium]